MKLFGSRNRNLSFFRIDFFRHAAYNKINFNKKEDFL